MLGGSGNDEMRSAQKLTSLTKESDVPGVWTAFTDKDNFGAGLVHIINSTHLEFNYMRTSSNQIYDSIQLVRLH
jgi:hypothetical protein